MILIQLSIWILTLRKTNAYHLKQIHLKNLNFCWIWIQLLGLEGTRVAHGPLTFSTTMAQWVVICRIVGSVVVVMVHDIWIIGLVKHRPNFLKLFDFENQKILKLNGLEIFGTNCTDLKTVSIDLIILQSGCLTQTWFSHVSQQHSYYLTKVKSNGLAVIP